jgi:predicted esterase
MKVENMPMEKRVCLIVVFAMCIYYFGFGHQEEFPFANYKEMRKHLAELYNQKKYGEAAAILKEALGRFPQQFFANSYNLALMYGHLGEYEKGTEVLSKCLKQGLWFGKYAFINKELWGPYKTLESFQAFLEENEILWKEAQKNAKPDLLVMTPEAYDSAREYPLFIALHGGNSNIANFKRSWNSERMKKEFIVAYVQSSQIISMNGFNWTEDIELSKKEIVDAYENTIQKYPVIEDKVIIGGFSSGGVASLEIVLHNMISVAGFIALCPAKTESFTPERVREAKERGVKGIILTTEMDPRLPDQREMNEILETENFPSEFIVTPDIGHWFPDDLDKKIDTAIAFILNDE